MRSSDNQRRIGVTLAGKYELTAVLGSGGMGVVYEAVNALTGRRVAIKLLASDLGSTDTRQRLLREARAAAAIQHPHVVDVLDVGIDADHGMFLVMELLRGESLEDWLAGRGRLSLDETCAILGPIAQALEVAHRLGVVHRDLKPSNIFLHTDGLGRRVPKLVDFGIARAEGPSLTATGTMAGTAGYMAPEQMKDSKRADARADIWALGVVAYQCLAGKLPFPGGSPIEVLASVLGGAISPLGQAAPATPPEAAAAIHQALSVDPERRPQRVSDLMRALGVAPATAGAATTAAPAEPEPGFATGPTAVGELRRAGATGPDAPTGGDPQAAGAVPGRATRPRATAAVTAAVTIVAVVVAGGGVAGVAAFRGSFQRAKAAAPTTAPGAGSGSASGDDDRPIAPQAARPLPRPLLVPIAGGAASLGSTPDEVNEARESCADEAGAAACPPRAFERETPLSRADVQSFRLGKSEITNRELLDWLAGQTDLRLRRRDGAAWISDAEGPLAALQAAATPQAAFALAGDVLTVQPDKADRPAVWVSRRAAQRLCHAAGLRLPTAAEWEWAARGPGRRRFPWGDALFNCRRAVAARSDGLACAALPRGSVSVLDPPVADRTPEGVTGLGGNVAEWVADPAPAAWAEPGATCADGACYVVKGGDWAAPSWRVRAAALRAQDATFAAGWLGWRCAGDEH